MMYITMPCRVAPPRPCRLEHDPSTYLNHVANTAVSLLIVLFTRLPIASYHFVVSGGDAGCGAWALGACTARGGRGRGQCLGARFVVCAPLMHLAVHDWEYACTQCACMHNRTHARPRACCICKGLQATWTGLAAGAARCCARIKCCSRGGAHSHNVCLWQIAIVTPLE